MLKYRETGCLGSDTAKLCAVGRRACAQAESTTEGTFSDKLLPHRDCTDTTAFRINWTGSALNTFYAAVRKALVVVIVVRAIWVLLGLAFGTWLLFW